MTKKKSTKFLIPLILLLTVVPQIVYIYEYDSNLTQFDWSASYDIKWDFFMYYKSVAVITIAAVMCLLLAYRYKARQKEFKLCYEFSGNS